MSGCAPVLGSVSCHKVKHFLLLVDLDANDPHYYLTVVKEDLNQRVIRSNPHPPEHNTSSFADSVTFDPVLCLVRRAGDCVPAGGELPQHHQQQHVFLDSEGPLCQNRVPQ